MQGGKGKFRQGFSKNSVKAASSIIVLSNKYHVIDKVPFYIPWFIMALKGLIENPVFLSVISSLFIAQLIKTIIYLLRRLPPRHERAEVPLRIKKKNPRDTLEILIWRTGGMPSSHSSMVSALATSVAFIEGIASNLFVVTLMFALIIIRDALGVRRSSGIQARALNWLGHHAAEKLKLDFKPVKEVVGHSPLEVAVGVILGIIIAAAFCFL